MEKNHEVDNALSSAVESYAAGTPVVVLAKDDSLLHGEETLKAIKGAGVSLACLTVRDIPRDYFEATDWPEILEAARITFMQDKWPSKGHGK